MASGISSGYFLEAIVPWRWEYFQTVMDGVYLVDGTLFEYNGRFWLFGAIRVEGGSSHDELYLFSGPSPFGPFTPHPKNPVVSDVRRARPAGRIFFDGGRKGRSLALPAALSPKGAN